ncbi:sporulation YhaL family protein [Ectobacillus sp. JY-23]|uniref:sporulation YhaL family protein n=1 Tax=Ectobacillus sp. JY-23 TaxID=2933872 RepID=UPI001FF3D32B|nr:sporulation YhaL family protein [Ectobacillus sp. JY-23]UOY92051.1 sporulation YhaL family protein [Ectobacillus sp. JY-23]
MELAWWVYLVMIGIVVSGYMVLHTAKKEEEMDREFIEREGEVYMKRLRAEQERRSAKKDENTLLL